MMRGLAKAVLSIALVFQLALGIQLLASPATLAHRMSAQSAPHCPEHVHHGQKTLKKQDCCHFSGCLNHCTPTAGPVMGLVAWAQAPVGSYLLPALKQPFSMTQPDEFFRPPIA